MRLIFSIIDVIMLYYNSNLIIIIIMIILITIGKCHDII